MCEDLGNLVHERAGAIEMAKRLFAFVSIAVALLSGYAEGATVEHVYDPLNRLVKSVYLAEGMMKAITYQYDVAGNMTGSTVSDDLPDTDEDGLPDILERTMCTDPGKEDTDGDGLLDGAEDWNHNGKLDPGETDPCTADTDGDGMPDGWEVAKGLNPLLKDSEADPDNDLFTNLEEYLAGTDPKDPQSKPVILKGDLNVDGSVNLGDAILALQVLAGMNQSNVDHRADVDGDGDIGLAEVVYILQHVAGFR
jgi:hypothetical protein